MVKKKNKHKSEGINIPLLVTIPKSMIFMDVGTNLIAISSPDTKTELKTNSV